MMEIEFFDDNPIPTFLPFDDQLSWYQQLVDAEHEVDSSTPNV
jgi:hypothetical protein